MTDSPPLAPTPARPGPPLRAGKDPGSGGGRTDRVRTPVRTRSSRPDPGDAVKTAARRCRSRRPRAGGRIGACPPPPTPGCAAVRPRCSPRPARPGEVRVLPAERPHRRGRRRRSSASPSGAIANSLVFDVDGAPLLVLTSGAHRVDEAKVADAARRARGDPRRRPEFVRRHTGQAIGGVAPDRPPRADRHAGRRRTGPLRRRSGPPPGTRTRSSPPPTRSCSGSPAAPPPRSGTARRRPAHDRHDARDPDRRAAHRGGCATTCTRRWPSTAWRWATTPPSSPAATATPSSTPSGPASAPSARSPTTPERRAAGRLRLRLPRRARPVVARPGARRAGPADGEEVAARRVRGVRAARPPRPPEPGLGRQLLHALVEDLPHPAALLSTPDADTKAFRLYHADGFVDLARGYHFPGDARPFAILGARLPLSPRAAGDPPGVTAAGPTADASTSSSSAPATTGWSPPATWPAPGCRSRSSSATRCSAAPSSTVERWPGVRVDRGSSAHVIIRHSGIVEELDLAAARPALRRLRPVGLRPRPAPGDPGPGRPAAGLLGRPRRHLRLDRRGLRRRRRRRLPPRSSRCGARAARAVVRRVRAAPAPGRAGPRVLAARRAVRRPAAHARRRPGRRLPRLRRRAARPLVHQRAAQGGAGLVRRPVRAADVRARHRGDGRLGRAAARRPARPPGRRLRAG